MADCFLALPFPDKVRDRLAQEADRLRLSEARVRWTPKEELHVPLRGFRGLEDEDLIDLDPIVHRVLKGRGPLSLVACGLGTRPEGAAPRTVHCGMLGEPEDLLASLRQELDTALAAARFPRDRSPFHPEVVLGRVRSEEGVEDLLHRIGPARRREFAHFKVREAILYEIQRVDGRVQHDVLRVFPL